MNRTFTPIDGARIFIGGITVAVFFYWWRHGIVFLPLAEPAAVAIAPEMDYDGGVGTGVAGLIATIIAGILWMIGTVTVVALTLLWGITKTVTIALLKLILSMTSGGRDLVQHFEAKNAAKDTSAPAGEPVGVAVSSDQPDIRGRLEAAEATLQKVIRVVDAHSLSLKRHRVEIDGLKAPAPEAPEAAAKPAPKKAAPRSRKNA